MRTLLLATLLVAAPLAAQERQTSGRPVPPEQACYDVLHYKLELKVDPSEQSIRGRLAMRARLLAPTEELIVDLDHRLEVESVHLQGPESVVGFQGEVRDAASFLHADDEIRVQTRGFQRLGISAGEEFTVLVVYGGRPRTAPRPPWDPGFTWETTADGSPWVSTTCQSSGADLWWPCKDQPDDEPDEGMELWITVPKPLVCATNGVLRHVVQHDPFAAPEAASEGWLTYGWTVSTPINNYGVALNIAPYETIERTYTSIDGTEFPVTYWVLPENVEKGKVLMEDILAQMRFMEQTFGPYPFRADKYGIAETPHLGMEHQSIIAYGNEYQGNPWGKQWGFDMLHLHEFAHEWWANLVTCPNWNDMWIHEGFATYTQALYVEELHGAEAYFEEMASYRPRVQNQAPVAPRRPKSTLEVYFDGQGTDVYHKGAFILHALRWVMGEEDFRTALRRFAYPDPAQEATTDGSACRFATTDDFLALCEELSGQELDWFFEVYLRQPALPKLIVERAGPELHLRWEVPGDLPFPMPIEVRVGSELQRIEMLEGQARVRVGGLGDHEVDPKGWVLRAE